ncbi:MAG: xanthine dehydrogenase accessory protein XdhC [Deltaproteobacteria bacterium]|nr:xanthine dehydrogenase accessory protein XdhC [Deltaproteobacteria bacterium]
MNFDKISSELKESKKAFCWATVVKADGSAPRHAGSKMIITEDGSTYGTVGGGGLEHQAIDDAKRILRYRTAECVSYDLTEEGIQPCGGRVEIFFEPVLPLMPIVVFGAGHVAEKLCPMLVELEFEVKLVDEREERLQLPAFKIVHERSDKLPSDYLSSISFADDLNLICLTHKHIHDEQIVEFCLDKPFRYFGLISSRKKWEYFCERYNDKGFTKEQMDRISTPIGLDIGSETPFEISVAIAAELIQLRAKPGEFKKGVGHFK